MRLIDPKSYYRTKSFDAVTLANIQRFPLDRLEYPVELLQYGIRDMQFKVGQSLIDSIWRSGGIATVALEISERDDHRIYNKEIELRARIQPAMIMQEVIKMEVPHLEFFPADWVCIYCATLNDGLKRRTCISCSAPKDLMWKERT